MLFARVPLALSTALAFHVCMSPPTGVSPAPGRNRPRDDVGCTRIYTAARFTTAMITKGFYWASVLVDILVLLAPYIPTSFCAIATSIPLTPLPLPCIRELVPLLSFPPAVPFWTTVGTSLAFTGALLRAAAYRALGQFYACPNPGPGPCFRSGPSPGPCSHHSPCRVRHAHALVTTGPYAFLRHPGYAGLLLSVTGFVMLHVDHVRGAGASAGTLSCWGIGVDVGQASVGMRTVALVSALLAVVGAIRRIQGEERTLSAQFKREWDLWAENVPYKLVPGVY